MDAGHIPSNTLDPRVKSAWRVQTALAAIPLAVVALAAAAWLLLAGFGSLLAGLVGVGGVVLAVLWVWPLTAIRYRRWRWEVNELEVRLQHGLIVIEGTVIPMVRVQHVDTSQGPIMKAFGLSEVKVSTAAGAHSIPALADEDASALRDKIAVLARVRDDGGL